MKNILKSTSGNGELFLELEKKIAANYFFFPTHFSINLNEIHHLMVY